MLLFTIQHTLYKKPNLNKGKAMYDMTIYSTVSENGHVLKEKWETDKIQSLFVKAYTVATTNPEHHHKPVSQRWMKVHLFKTL